MRLVFFDFDGTLTKSDTLWPFARVLSESRRHRGTVRIAVALSLFGLRVGLRSNHAFKQRFIQLLVQGQSTERMRQLSEQFHQTVLTSLLNKDVFEALSRHTLAGDHVYLVSSNFDFFLEPLRTKWNLKGIFATKTEVEAGRFTGRLLGSPCDGKEKLERVLAFFGEKRVRDAVAYADSANDRYLLGIVKTSHWVSARRSFKINQSIPTA